MELSSCGTIDYIRNKITKYHISNNVISNGTVISSLFKKGSGNEVNCM